MVLAMVAHTRVTSVATNTLSSERNDTTLCGRDARRVKHRQ